MTLNKTQANEIIDKQLSYTPRIKFRIQNSDFTYLNAGTGLDSWFTLEQARKLCDYSKGQRIVEHDGVNVLWEMF